MIRITAGRHRGRRLAVPEDNAVRPTTDRAREGLFNVLAYGDFGLGGRSPVTGARVLDAFAGCGALGLEALSRGAAHATFLEADRRACAEIERNLKTLDEKARGTVQRGDALHPPPARTGACDLAFLDPPYRQGLAAPALDALAAAGWLAPGAIVVVEQEAGEDLTLPDGCAVLDERRYGRTRFALLRYRASSQS